LSYIVECAEQCPNQIVFQQITKTLAANKLVSLDQFDATKQRSSQVMKSLTPAESLLGFPFATAREEWIKSTTVTEPHPLKATIDAENAEWTQMVQLFSKDATERVKAFAASKPVHRTLAAKASSSYSMMYATCETIVPGSKPIHLVLQQQPQPDQRVVVVGCNRSDRVNKLIY
jgi:hypothetical protein